jgi:hypothetical protein
VYREREKERERGKKNREKTQFFSIFPPKKLIPSKKIKLKKYKNDLVPGFQDRGVLSPWYQGSHLSL